MVDYLRVEIKGRFEVS